MIFRSFRVRPLPLHWGQGLSIILPLPLHVGQGITRTNMPKAFLVVLWTFPAPLHRGQDLADVLGAAPLPPQTSHFSILSISTSFCAPFAASSRVI